VDCQISRVREEKAGACEWERAAVDVVSFAPRSANWLLQRLYVWPCLISFFWLLQRLYVWPCLISFLCKVVELSSACGILQRPIKHLGESDIAGTGMCLHALQTRDARYQGRHSRLPAVMPSPSHGVIGMHPAQGESGII
jgi:hypothetical protein